MVKKSARVKRSRQKQRLGKKRPSKTRRFSRRFYKRSKIPRRSKRSKRLMRGG